MRLVIQALTSRYGKGFLFYRGAKVHSLLMRRKALDMTCKMTAACTLNIRWVTTGRADENASWREGANNLKGMGEIDTSLNTGLAVGWQITSAECGRQSDPACNGQSGVNRLCYAASSTNQSGHDCFSVCIPVWRQPLPQYGMASVSSRVSAPVIAVIQRPVDSTV